MDTLRGERGGQAGPPRGRVGWAAASVAALVATAAPAAEIDTGREDLKIRWDNTVKYSAAQRLKDPSPALLGNPNNDDGNRQLSRCCWTWHLMETGLGFHWETCCSACSLIRQA